MFGRIWRLLRDSVQAFIEDDALSRGASISFYTVTSIGPMLFIVIAVAGLAFGEDAARGAIAARLSDLTGKASADLVQTAVQSASDKSSGILASVVGAATLLITASSVFGEMQSALNAIWKTNLRALSFRAWCGLARRASVWSQRSASCCWSLW
ncbi:MAG TPA: YhjD/YihY/BrkB family envelope integrity protein [Acetobacteraceae bacterium]|jgi:membrane protein|nr:YhjD/YihY/BrkB family envelope integrity protein [Acetobacteraceae bacterium]